MTVPRERLYSLDAFRGFTMIWMISEGFGLQPFLQHPLVGPLARQFTHAEWVGVHAWDLIQPFFMFIVGAAMPFAFSKRWSAGERWTVSLGHVLKRCALLVFWGLVARSIRAGEPTLDLINVLAQIAFAYLVAFLALRWRWQAQLVAAFALLAGHWALYCFSSAPGVTGPYDITANIGWWIDRTLLGRNYGAYATINCVSSSANTLFGVLAGRLLASSAKDSRKAASLAASGIGAAVLGLILSPAIPLIKRIWTASFALYSAGFALLVLAGFYLALDVWRMRRGTALMAAVGANSIFIYLFHEILKRWMYATAPVFTGWAIALWADWGRMVSAWMVFSFELYVCWWLYRRKIFFKL